jgi:CRP/FNR family cyclic AMP-dependent transcriptional regulator
MGDEMGYFPIGSGRTSGTPGLSMLRKAELIRGVEIFSQATVEELYRLAGLAVLVEFTPSGVIFGEGDLADSFYVLVEGSVELTSEIRQARETVGPGGAFGLQSVLTRERRGATATALEPTVALSIAGEDLFTVLSNDMEMLVSIFRHFAKKLNSRTRG